MAGIKRVVLMDEEGGSALVYGPLLATDVLLILGTDTDRLLLPNERRLAMAYLLHQIIINYNLIFKEVFKPQF